MAFCSFLTYYLKDLFPIEATVFAFSLVGANFIAVTLVNIERRLCNRFMKECLQGSVKKQTMDRFVLCMVSRLIHTPFKQGCLEYNFLIKAFKLKERGESKIASLH
jgi:hypothetical protein